MLLLSEPLPLRSTRDIGDYAEDKPLPLRFGNLSGARFPLIRLTDERWFAADHPMDITRVFADDREIAGWDMRIESDAAGRSWTVVRTAAAIPAASGLSACGYGKLNGKTGTLIENPADIFRDILQFAGRSGDFLDSFRAECAAEGLLLAGSLDTRVSIREALDTVALSAGAIWTPNLATLYPSGEVEGFVLESSGIAVNALSLVADLDDTADIVRLGFDREDATGRSQQAIILAARPYRYGGLAVERLLPWLRTARDAERVGKRMVRRMAGERYAVNCDASLTELRPCWRLRLTDLRGWRFEPDPEIRVLSVDVDYDAGGVAIAGEYLRRVPEVTVTAHSLALSSTAGATVEVAFENGIATLVFRDEDGNPLIGAQVSLDNSIPKTTDARGTVTFATTKGVHRMAMEAPGIVPIFVDIVL